jgi:hypothetical protein
MKVEKNNVGSVLAVPFGVIAKHGLHVLTVLDQCVLSTRTK